MTESGIVVMEGKTYHREGFPNGAFIWSLADGSEALDVAEQGRLEELFQKKNLEGNWNENTYCG